MIESTITIGDIARRVANRPLTAIVCPHCLGPMKKRSSRLVATNVQQLLLQCLDVECGATYGADLTLTHQISPSGKPRDSVHLRTVPPRRRGAANDDGICGSEVPQPGEDAAASG